MNDVEVEFVERFGLMSEEDGMPRISGRIFALLLLQEEALCLDDIAEKLQVSKTSVSTNTRLLDRMGILERTGKPGDRRTFYRISPDALAGSIERIRQRTEETIELLDSTIPKLDDEKSIAINRLSNMRAWNSFIIGELEDLLARFEERESL